MAENHANGSNQPQANQEQQPQPVVNVQRVYIKDVSFEAPNAPAIFERQEWKPEIKLDLDTRTEKVKDNTFDVTLMVTVTAKLKEEVAFLCEVKQAGTFFIDQMNEQQLAYTLGSYCPNMLYHYVRETISSLTNKGNFPPLNLQPVNFDALFAQAVQRQKEKQEGTEQVAEAKA